MGDIMRSDHAKRAPHEKNAPLSVDKSAFFVAKGKPNGAELR